jgi:plasmid stabilization system protein ParE
VSRRLVLRPQAQDEITEAAEWYDARGRGLAAEFLRALEHGTWGQALTFARGLV